MSWHHAGFRLFWRLRSSFRRRGRPKVSEEIRQLILTHDEGKALVGLPQQSPRSDRHIRFLTITFRVLYCFFFIEHDRRRILQLNAPAHPTSDWIVQQLREALPLPCRYQYILFDRDANFGTDIRVPEGEQPASSRVEQPKRDRLRHPHGQKFGTIPLGRLANLVVLPQ